MKVHEQTALIAATIAKFPSTFGLRAYPDKVFRIGARQSFISDEGVVMLYTQCLYHTRDLPKYEQRGHNPDGFTWLDFAKGTEDELAGQLAPIPERWLNETRGRIAFAVRDSE